MDLPEGQASGPATEMFLWEQPEEGDPGPLSLEEQILTSMFEACDPHKTGTVVVTHVLAYLEAVTGQDSQDTRLQTLAQSLDPYREGPGATVDLDTFLIIMRDWIAACQLHGGLEPMEETTFGGALASQHLPSERSEAEEPANLESFGGEDPRPEWPATADLLSSLEDLELSNRRLAGENAKLQRSVETAEEGSARLGEEISSLRKQLRSTQQALQMAKAVDEELEDLKTLAKSLEEQNHSLLAQARHTEKEQQHLVAKVETLQEENGKLLVERDGVKRRSEELATEKDALKRQLCECELLICQREAILSERTRHAESLAKSLEEYRTTTQELRQEISQLEEQLSRSQESPDESRKQALASPVPCVECGNGRRLNVPLGTLWDNRLPGRQEEDAKEKEEESHIQAGSSTPLRDHHGDSPESPPDSHPTLWEPQQALMPVVTELVPIRRSWAQHCLCPQPPQHLRVTQHPLIPAPVLGLLLLLLLSVLLLGQTPPPTWPHLQLYYLQPPPV